MYVGITEDVFLFTDRDTVSGGLATSDGRVTLLTQGSTRLLGRALFPSDTQDAKRDAPELSALIGDLFPGLSPDEIARTAEHALAAIPRLVGLEQAPELGIVSEQTVERDCHITVGDHDGIFCPAGRLLTRTINGQTAHLAIGATSLAGVVSPNPSLAIVEADANEITVQSIDIGSGEVGVSRIATGEPLHGDTAHGPIPPRPIPPRPRPPQPKPKPKPHPGPHCGACGACGTCGLCEGINIGAAVAAATAISALGIVGNQLHGDREQRAKQDVTPSSVPARIAAALQPLVEIASALDDGDERTDTP